MAVERPSPAAARLSALPWRDAKPPSVAEGGAHPCPEIEALQRAERPPTASDVRWALKPRWEAWRGDPKLATGVLEILSKRRRGPLALEVLRCMRDERVEIDSLHCNMVIGACGKSGDWRLALSVLGELMPQLRVAPNVVSCNSASSACRDGGQEKRAVEVFASMAGLQVRPNAVSCLVAISAYERGAEWAPALALLSSMPALHLEPSANSCTTAIGACEKALRWREAVAVLGTMGGLRLEPTVMSYSSVISALEKVADWQQALALFASLPSLRIDCDAISYNAAISACEKGAQWRRALVLLGDMRGALVAPSAVSCNAAMSACEKGAQWQRALALFGAMPGLSLAPDVFSCNTAVTACEKGGQWRRALALFDSMPRRSVPRDAISYTCVLDAVFDRRAGHAVFLSALEANAFPDLFMAADGGPTAAVYVLDLHDLTAGAAVMVTAWWLMQLPRELVAAPWRRWVRIVTGFGKSLADSRTSVVKAAVEEFLDAEGVPWREIPETPGCLSLPAASVRAYERRARGRSRAAGGHGPA